MRFIELHSSIYTDEREVVIINFDNVTSIVQTGGHSRIYTNRQGEYYDVRESLDLIKAYIRALNQLECKYDDYYDKHPIEKEEKAIVQE